MEAKNIKDKTLAECWNMTVGDFIKMISQEMPQMCPAETAARVIQEVAEPQQCNMEVEVTELLRQLGVPAHIKGYKYLRDAIIFALEEPEALERVTKILYPEVAKMNGTISSRTERAIRHAIETAWDRGDVILMDRLFGYTVNSNRGKPTNGEFIATVVDHLKLKFNLG